MLRFVSPRWRKVIRDIWDNKARTILVVLAIAVGVFAFGGVFISQSVLIHDMNTGYAATNPASVILGVSPFDESLVRAVEGLRGVKQAEGRATDFVKVTNGDSSYNIDLTAVGDFENMKINLIEPETGSWPPGQREVLLERTTAATLGNPEIGDPITIELPTGETRELIFGGTIYDMSAVPANLFPQLTGYVNLSTMRYLGESGQYGRIYIVLDDEYDTLPEIEAKGEDIKDRIESYGYGTGGVQAQEPGKHWAADVTQTFTTILSGIGLFALILSGFLVLNTISAVLTQQKRQIGMMKSIGATGWQVMGVYMAMVLVFGVLSLFVALPVGLVLAQLSTIAVANFLNVNITDLAFPGWIFRMPLWVLGLEILAALIAPLIAALLPILGGTRTTVREAVSDYGVGTKTRRGWFDKMIAHVRGLPRPTLLSLRNTFRRKGRLALTLTTLTLAGAIFIAVVNVRGSLMQELDNQLKIFNFDVQVALDNAYPISRLERESARVEGITRAEGWAFASAQIERGDGSLGSNFTIFGPPSDTPFIEPTMAAGRWLQPEDQNAIVLGSEIIRDEPDVQVGDEIWLKMGDQKRKWEVVGIVSLVGLPYAYANFDYLSRVQGAPGQAYALFLGTEDKTAKGQQAAADNLEERFKRSGIGVAQLLTQQTLIGANVNQFNFLIGFMLVMAVMLAVVGGLGLAGTMSLNVLERTREIGVMRAIGASNGSVRSVVLVEGVLIGLISWVIAQVVAIPASIGFAAAIGYAFFERPLPSTFSTLGSVAWLFIVLGIAAIASLLPARRAARISVRESLAYE